MALKSTIYKAELQVSDIDNNRYQNHSITLAMHPSETEERMMIRLLAFALNADSDLKFGKGLSNEEDAALWKKDLTDHIQLWIDVGLPDEKRVKRASHKADAVRIYCYGERTAPIWWQQNKRAISQFSNVQVIRVSDQTREELQQLCQRTMRLHCNIMDNVMTLGDDKHSVNIDIEVLQEQSSTKQKSPLR